MREQYFKVKGVVSPKHFPVKVNENQRPFYLMLEVPADSSEDSFYQVTGEKTTVRVRWRTWVREQRLLFQEFYQRHINSRELMVQDMDKSSLSSSTMSEELPQASSKRLFLKCIHGLSLQIHSRPWSKAPCSFSSTYVVFLWISVRTRGHSDLSAAAETGRKALWLALVLDHSSYLAQRRGSLRAPAWLTRVFY